MANKTSARFDEQIQHCREIFRKKTYDYGASWRVLSPKSLTDQLFIKAQRTKQIEDNKGKILISEGIDAGYRDIVNFALFALIKLNEK